ncbi:MAG: hypothetical protein JSS86_25925, partial [Cyanobacteria bacterium SZAS LIN-2]|nr:hypothetical protein [Cyanobacteria bacterium SZAS LIN-2]
MKSRSNDWLKVARPFLVVFVCSFVLPISGIAADLPQSEPVIKDKYDCELIFVGQCLGAKLSSNVSETQPPVARFNPYRILKGPPLPTYYNVRYDFWSGLKPDNFDYSQITQSLMPSLNSLWILYIPIAVPSSDGKSETSLKTYRGAEGREELTLANFDKFVAWRNVWLRSHNLDVIDRDLEYWQLISAAYSRNPELFVQQDVVLRGRFGVRSNANPVLYTDAGPPVELFNANLRAIPDGSKLQVVGKLNYAEPDTAVVSSLGVAPGHYYFNAAG